MRRSSLAKAAVIVSSLTLVGAYILYQSGGAMLPGSKSGRIRTTAETEEAQSVASTQPTESSTLRRVMSSSKSGAVVDRDDPVLYSDSPATQPTTRASSDLSLRP